MTDLLKICDPCMSNLACIMLYTLPKGARTSEMDWIYCSVRDVMKAYLRGTPPGNGRSRICFTISSR